MKRILAMLTAALMLFAFASCGGDGSTVSSGDVSSTETPSTDVSSTSDETNTTTYAPQENGVGNTTLSGIEIKDQDGDGVIRVACVGDSITAGNQGNNWPLYLQEYLNELSKTDGNTYEVRNHGKGAAAVHHVEETVGDLNWGWGTVTDADGDGKAYFYYDDVAYTTALEYTPDVVIVQMGTNDAFGSWKTYLADDYYNYLVKPFADKGALVILSTPPYASNGNHDTVVNGEMHDGEVQMAWDLGLPIVDTNRLLYGWKEVFADGLHGNSAGYSLMALNFYKYIFGGDPNTVTVTAQPGTKIVFIDEQGRSYNRDVPASGEVVVTLSPAEVTYNVSAECDGYLTYRETITVNGDMELKPEQKAAENVALSGTAFDCGVAVYGGVNVAANVIDGALTSGGYQPASYKKGDYVGVEFTKTSVTNINIYWETEAYVSAFSKNGYEVEFKINGEWKKQTASELNVVRNAYTGDVVCDVITVNTPAEIEGVKITFLDGEVTNHKYAPKLYELEVFEG